MGTDRVTTGMSMASRKPVLLTGLLIVLAALVARTMLAGGAEKAGVSPAKAMAGFDARSAAQPEIIVPSLPSVVIDWPRGRGRDPFKSDLVHPPAPSPPPPPAQEEVPVVNGPDREALIEEARTQLSLSGTIVGDHGTAMINGGMHRIGDVVAGFRIRRIESRGIVVEREGVHLFIPVTR